MNENEKYYLQIMDELKKMMRDKEYSDEEIYDKISENSEMIKMIDQRSGCNLFIHSVLCDRMKLAQKLADHGANIHLEVKGSLYSGNALNVAKTPECADWLLSIGIQIEKNLEQNSQERTTPYDNPAIVAAAHNDFMMLRYWLTKEREVFADDPQYVSELYTKAIEMCTIVNQPNMLAEILGDKELYPLLEKAYCEKAFWDANSIKKQKKALKSIEDRALQDKAKKLVKILNQRAKEI